MIFQRINDKFHYIRRLITILKWLKQLFCRDHNYVFTGVKVLIRGEGTKMKYICSKCNKVKETWLIRAKNMR